MPFAKKHPGASRPAAGRGQGLTEYLIIIALIVIAAIGVYSFFGQNEAGQQSAGAREAPREESAEKDTAAAPSAPAKVPAKPAEPERAGDAKSAAAGK
jgi:hypothetical protein